MSALYALTLHRPWPWAIFHAGKTVENRGWEPPHWLIGKHLAIHAGKKFDADAVAWIQQTFGMRVPLEVDQVAGAIIGVVKVVGFHPPNDPKVASPWAVGPVCWQLAEPVALRRPVPCRGFQKLWLVPPAELVQVRTEWQAARGRAA